MSFPTFRAILTRVQTDLGSAADGTTPRGTPEYALSRALAGLSKHLFSALAYIVRQCSPITADETYGWRWGQAFGITQTAALAWRGTATATGVATTVIHAGTEFQRSDGQLYTVDADATIGVDTTAQISLTAETAGADADNPDGQILSLTSPITGVDTDCTVTASTQSGADVEDWSTGGLVRLLARLRNPPKGGGPGDYVAWAKEVGGVTRAWEFPLLEAPNSVSVAFARDNDGTGVAAIPDSGECATVLAHLQTEAPITVDVRVITLVDQAVAFTFTALNPNTTAVHTAIEASLTDLLQREGGPGLTIPFSRVEDAVSSAVGVVSFTMTVPSADVTSLSNQLPTLGTVTYP